MVARSDVRPVDRSSPGLPARSACSFSTVGTDRTVQNRATAARARENRATLPQTRRLTGQVAPRNSTQAASPSTTSGSSWGKKPVSASTLGFTGGTSQLVDQRQQEHRQAQHH